MLKAIAAMPITNAPMTAVLALQLPGWAYQPPAGDQTSLGYLRSAICQNAAFINRGRQNQGLGSRDLSTSTHCDRDVTEGVLGE